MKLFKEYFWPRLFMDLVTFYPPLMVFGIVAAELNLTTEVIVGIIANYLMLFFSFMYNDVADRKDDEGVAYAYLPFIKHLRLNMGWYKKDGFKRFKNPFSWNNLSLRTGYLILFLVAIISIVISYWIAPGVMVVAIANIFLGIIYSGGILRLKAHPFVDVISHSFLLAFVQILYFLAYFEANVDFASKLILIGATLTSMGGALENQFRDFKEDQDAKLKNTASLIGRRNSKLVSLCFIVIGAIMLFLGMLSKLT